MQPRPIAETSKSLFPSFRFFIFQSGDGGMYSELSLRRPRSCLSCREIARNWRSEVSTRCARWVIQDPRGRFGLAFLHCDEGDRLKSSRASSGTQEHSVRRFAQTCPSARARTPQETFLGTPSLKSAPARSPPRRRAIERMRESRRTAAHKIGGFESSRSRRFSGLAEEHIAV